MRMFFITVGFPFVIVRAEMAEIFGGLAAH